MLTTGRDRFWLSETDQQPAPENCEKEGEITFRFLSPNR